MERVGADHGGGSLTLLRVLRDYWGAAERDLYTAGLCWDDLGSRALPWHALVSFMLNPGPTTSLYLQQTEGYGVLERLNALQLDALKLLLWSKTKDAQKESPRHRPKPTWQPGMPEEEPELKEFEVMTIEDYMDRVGMT
jgi:hypothetical protein